MPDGGTELVLGLVGAVGTDLQTVERDLADRLEAYGYKTTPIRLSQFLKALDPQLPQTNEYERLKAYMKAGTDLRRNLMVRDRPAADALALFSANAIAEGRNPRDPPRHKTAYILRSLKHPEEVKTLREIYGPGFYLVAAWSPRTARLRHLEESKAIAPQDAADLVSTDEAETDPESGLDNTLGQRTRDTFHLADVFVAPRDEQELCRFLDLIFSHPFHSPRRDEHAMFLAYAASLRSGDLSRQVGAVLLSEDGDVIATGSNDVPAPGGGLYWPGSHDQRDHKRGHDANSRRKAKIIQEVEAKVRPHLVEGAPDVGSLLRGTALHDLTEFGRAVHAEMEALLSAARTGRRTRGATLYTTTFPCHNCTKHIIAAGLRRVVFIEAYPKSLARELHSDAIEIVGEPGGDRAPEGSPRRVRFEQFSGVGPRRFFDLFSMTLGSGSVLLRKGDDGAAATWMPSSAEVRTPMLPTSYLEREQAAAQVLATAEALRKK